MSQDIADLNVLVVDDEPSVTRLVKMMLLDFNVTQVFTAKNGREALDFLGDFDDLVDVVICDWNMPRVSGLEVLQQIRTVDPEAPFLMLTGRADLDSVKAAKDLGVDGYLLKPFSAEQLKEKLLVVARNKAG
ncbi:MAG: response regulator [Alphaproteobacteria bacterium]|nr:response regulator [Alphaproteobacteria bacterium]